MLASQVQKIVVIGYGQMGRAIVEGWRAADLDVDVVPVYPSHTDGYTRVAEAADAITDCDIVMLAVKPQIMADICAELAPLLPIDTPVISIAAGLDLAFYEEALGTRPIVRVMPNLPVLVQQGMNVCVANDHVRDADRAAVGALFSACGQVMWLGDEVLMDGVTAVSGSGPAYLFYFIESLAKAAEASGFSADMAMALARQTVVGASAMAQAQSESTVSAMREAVTSKGGTTEAALERLMDGDLDRALREAVALAVERGVSLRGK